MRLGILSGDSMELVDGLEMEGLMKTVQDDSRAGNLHGSTALLVSVWGW